MNLEELLSELRENLLRDNAELASGPNDQLWTDETLVRYINDAQQRFARKTLSLRDASTPEVVQVTLATGVSSYALHASVLAVVSARYSTDTADLARVGRARVMVIPQPDPPWFDPSTVSQMNPGRPIAVSTDETLDVDTKAVTLTVYPAPSATENGTVVYLRVARLPLEKFTIDEMDMDCELDEDYQLDMLEWAAFRALRTSDIDGHSDQAEKHKDRFTEAGDAVLKDIRRKMQAPIRFAFGQNGFTWEN
jgi:hypothetical protein